MSKTDLIQILERECYENEVEKLKFYEEMACLNKHEHLKPLLKASNITFLLRLYRLLMNRQTVFTLNLKQGKNDWLTNYFNDLLEGERQLPKGSIALKALVTLCSNALESAYLIKILDSKMLDTLSVDRLELICKLSLTKVQLIVNFFNDHFKALPTDKGLLGIEILALLPHEKLVSDTPALMALFMEKYFDSFLERFQIEFFWKLFDLNPGLIADWFKLWELHYIRHKANRDSDHTYFKTDFHTIVKYCPAYILWNNGIKYRSRRKVYTFGSPEFMHIASGGKLSKGPDPRPYTRRMAKVFVTLPYSEEIKGDAYLYIFGKAYGASPRMIEGIQKFVHHAKDGDGIKKELEKWAPVIQKLVAENFDIVPDREVEDLFGYLAHCLRDKPNFSLQRRSMQSILRDRRNYYRHINERAALRRERELERIRQQRKKAEQEVVQTWKSHTSIKPWGFSKEGKKYKIIELTSRNMINQEGAQMRHCVGSYAISCINGNSSIWSLRLLDENKNRKSIVTIEIQKLRLVQSYGKMNKIPSEKEMNIIKIWCRGQGIKF